jgi:hypothetical protein
MQESVYHGCAEVSPFAGGGAGGFAAGGLLAGPATPSASGASQRLRLPECCRSVERLG